MSKQQLTQLLIKDDKPFQQRPPLWFDRYNHVIDVYHNSLSTNKPVLEKLSSPHRFHLVATYLINNYLLNIAMVLVFTFLPLFNLALLVLMMSYAGFVKRQTKKHKGNLQKVEDPFENFYFYPQMCRQLQKHFTTLKLTVEEIQNFKFNDSQDKLRQNLVAKQSQSQSGQNQSGQEVCERKKTVKVPIYDQEFYDGFFLVKKQYYKALSWVVLGFFLIALDILFYFGVFEDFFLN